MIYSDFDIAATEFHVAKLEKRIKVQTAAITERDKRIAELQQAIADHIRLQGIQFENGVKEGMERAAEIVDVIECDCPFVDNLHEGYCPIHFPATAIRMEIDNE